MREIKFKAKTCNGKWVEGLLAHKDNKWYISNKVGMPFAYEVRPETISQYTGLKDKNGKEIYENDIVGFYWQDKCSCGLVGYGAFNCTCCDGVYGWHFGEEDIREHYDYEVIGNKFDNPELLNNTDKQAGEYADNEILKSAT